MSCLHATTLGDLLPNVDEALTVESIANAIATAVMLSNGACCHGLIEDGQLGCTCWTKLYDTEQAPPDFTDTPVPMPRGCGDCAYRPDSPERQGATHVAGDATFLERIVESGETFWCHDGMRQAIALVHPTGATIYLPPNVSYAPTIVDGIPYRADGRAGAICAGWATRREAHLKNQANTE